MEILIRSFPSRVHLLTMVLVVIPCLPLAAQQIAWKTLPLPIAAADRYDDIFFISPQVGWAIDGGNQQNNPYPINGRIYKTIDGGFSWALQFDSSINYLRSIRFVDSMHGWAGTLGLDMFDPRPDSTLLYETTNGGTTWSVADSKIEGTKPAGLCGMFAVDNNTVYICGKFSGPAYILKTTNSGKSWRSIDMNSYASKLVDIYFWSRDSGIVVGGIGPNYTTSSAIVLFTSDGGASWSARYQSDTTDGWCWKISFPTRNVGYVSIETERGANGFLTTTDGGMTWVKRLANFSPSDLQGIGFITDKLGWLGGSGINVYATTDGGDSWTYGSDASNVNRFRFFGDTLAYCAGKQVYKITLTWPEDVSPSNEILDLSAQNYPNPFEDFTEIRFFIPREEHVTLRLFDFEGKKLSELVYALLPAGNHSIPLTISEHQLPAGNYFYELTTGGTTVERRMLRVR